MNGIANDIHKIVRVIDSARTTDHLTGALNMINNLKSKYRLNHATGEFKIIEDLHESIFSKMVEVSEAEGINILQ